MVPESGREADERLLRGQGGGRGQLRSARDDAPTRSPCASYRSAGLFRSARPERLYRDLQHDLADVPAALHQPVRFGYLGQREGRMDHRAA